MYGVLFFVCGAFLLALADGVVVNRSSAEVAQPNSSAALGSVPASVRAQIHLNDQSPVGPSLSHQLFIASLIALGVMTVAALALGWIMAGRALRPVREMTAAA
jgi:hypothetical protein